jgi:tetratricopeptide (TPR) repeat protein
MQTASAPSTGRFRSASSPRWRRLLLALVCLGIAGSVAAHGDLDLQIRAVSAKIAAAPSATLYLKRGILHHQHEDYTRALEDYDRATDLAPTLDGIELARGRTLFQAGRPGPARSALDAFLRRAPDHADACLLRARILARLQDHAEAIRDFNRHLALAPEPTPEAWLDRAASLVASGDKPGGLASLDEAIRRQGSLVTLQNAAIALELELGRPDAALARLDRIAAGLERKESWLARRAEILETAGRADEARRACQEALSAIERLPARHREAPAMRDLESRLRARLRS